MEIEVVLTRNPGTFWDHQLQTRDSWKHQFYCYVKLLTKVLGSFTNGIGGEKISLAGFLHCPFFQVINAPIPELNKIFAEKLLKKSEDETKLLGKFRRTFKNRWEDSQPFWKA